MFIKKIQKKLNIIYKKIEFSHKSAKIKNAPINSGTCATIYLIADRGYAYKISGRCMSFRSRGKISSFLLRNISYGIEQRIFISNPLLDIYR